MSSKYTTSPGDTFEKIARKVYGDERQAQQLAEANPGAIEPLAAAVSLVVPALPGAPSNVPQQGASTGANDVALLVGGQRFRFWERVRITRSLDAVDTLDVFAPFESDNAAFREAFRPFTYNQVELTVGGDRLFNGTMVGVEPTVGAKRRTVEASAYSRPGVLGDCTAPASAYPLEFTGQGLKEISSKLCAPFGLTVEFNGDPGAPFELAAAKVDERILSFLVKLAQQRGLVISSTPDGGVLFQSPGGSGNPVANLSQGNSPVLEVLPRFSPQRYYSHVTGIDPVIVGLDGSQYTVKNPRLPDIVRPFTFKAPDSAGGGINKAVEAKAGRMFGNTAAYTVSLSTWRDPSGNLWAPNTSVLLEAPDAMVYSPYIFLIRSVILEKDSTSETAVLELVFPGAFSGQIPEKMPWDE